VSLWARYAAIAWLLKFVASTPNAFVGLPVIIGLVLFGLLAHERVSA